MNSNHSNHINYTLIKRGPGAFNSEYPHLPHETKLIPITHYPIQGIPITYLYTGIAILSKNPSCCSDRIAFSLSIITLGVIPISFSYPIQAQSTHTQFNGNSLCLLVKRILYISISGKI